MEGKDGSAAVTTAQGERSTSTAVWVRGRGRRGVGWEVAMRWEGSRAAGGGTGTEWGLGWNHKIWNGGRQRKIHREVRGGKGKEKRFVGMGRVGLWLRNLLGVPAHLNIQQNNARLLIFEKGNFWFSLRGRKNGVVVGAAAARARRPRPHSRLHPRQGKGSHRYFHLLPRWNRLLPLSPRTDGVDLSLNAKRGACCPRNARLNARMAPAVNAGAMTRIGIDTSLN